MKCSKRYDDIPFAHRQHTHDGHCAYIHGHNWSFEFTFEAVSLDENGFVVDFGKLRWLKQYLEETFDHALVLNDADPYRTKLEQVLGLADMRHEDQPSPSVDGRLAKITTVPSASSEGLAKFLFDRVNLEIRQRTSERVWLAEVTVHEDSKNRATYAA